MSLMFNIHRVASMIIPMQAIEYRNSSGVTISDSGLAKVSYGDWKKIKAHVQPGIVASFGSKNLSEQDYKELGLDWSRLSMTVWLSNSDVQCMALKQSTDQFKINGHIFNILKIADWNDFNGWKRVYCAEILP